MRKEVTISLAIETNTSAQLLSYVVSVNNTVTQANKTIRESVICLSSLGLTAAEADGLVEDACEAYAKKIKYTFGQVIKEQFR
jgi:hypothetical protein